MSDLNSQEFIQDFLDETGELLRSVHKNLLILEESLSPLNNQADMMLNRENVVSELFRSFHTIKGLSGMVGLEPAMEVSHTLESILRGIQQSKIEISTTLIDHLLHGVKILEGAIDTFRNPVARMPSIQDYLDESLGLLPEETKSQLTPSKQEVEGHPPAKSEDEFELELPESIRKFFTENDYILLKKAASSGLVISLAMFTPSAQKSAQSINVNEVRQKLSTAGTLLKAAPMIAGSQVRFTFLIASQGMLSPQDFPEMEWTILKNGETEVERKQSLPEPTRSQKRTPKPEIPAAQSASPGLTPTVRVDLERLDELVRLVGELYVCRTRIVDHLERIQINPQDKQQAAILDSLLQSAGQMERNLRELRQATTRARMVPLAYVFGHMPLVVRNLARASHKEVRLVLEGENTEIDRILVERLLDPLLHLVRNAIMHGVETPAEREAVGKPPQGVLTLRGQPAGDHILVSVSDDGRGIDFERIARKAIEDGFWGEEELRLHGPLTVTEALELISLTGFSTRESADLGAGRGMGLDVVARMVAEMSGSLNMHSLPGQGTTFTLRLPLTLTIVKAILVRSGEERYAINLDQVDEVIEIDPQAIVRLESGELYPYQDNSLVLYRLSDLFHLSTPSKSGNLYALLGGQTERRIGLVVDQLISLREVVVRTISDPLVAQPEITGATELGDGSMILILDLPAVFQLATSLKKEARRAG